MSKYVGVTSCYKENVRIQALVHKNVHAHISAKAPTAILAGASASQGLHALRRTQRRQQMKNSIQHPLGDERNRGVILNGRGVSGFLNSGLSEIYEVKRKPFHMVEHLSTAALNESDRTSQEKCVAGATN